MRQPAGGQYVTQSSPCSHGPVGGRIYKRDSARFGDRPQASGYSVLQRPLCLLVRVRERVVLPRFAATFIAGVSETANARARSASSVRSRRNGVIDTQLCSMAQRSVPLAAPSNGITVNQKIERPIGSLSGTTFPS